MAVVLAGLALLLPAQDAAAYIIWTKDGNRIEARERPSIQGKRLLFLTPLGSPRSISVDEWDQARTEKANQDGLGNAYILEDRPDTKVIPNPVDKKPSLSDYIKTHKKNELGETKESQEKPAAEKAPVKQREAEPQLDPQVNEVFARALEAAGGKGAKLAAVPGGVRVQATTDNEQQVFWMIGAAARGLKEVRAHGRQVNRVQLRLVTTNGESAGQFEMTPEDADALLDSHITPAKYFVSNVLF